MAKERRKEDRDIDFYNTCEEVRKQFNGYVSIEDLTKIAVYKEAKEFYLSEEECAIALEQIKNNKIRCKHKVKSAMYYDIRKLYIKLLKEAPDITNTEASRIIVKSKAPRFYINEDSAKKLYYKIINEYL